MSLIDSVSFHILYDIEDEKLLARLQPSHLFRVLAARGLGPPAADARHFVLGTAALSVLGYEHTLDEPAILLWNDDRHAVP